jgi:hypothetical protein
MQSSLASGASRDFFGLLRVGRRDFRGSDGEYATRVFVPGGGSRVTVGSDVTVALLTRNVSVNVSCSALMVRCPLSVVCASCHVCARPG